MRVHSTLVASGPEWCDMPPARGEKIVRSVPRFFWKASWFGSRQARNSSSDDAKVAGQHLHRRVDQPGQLAVAKPGQLRPVRW